MYCINTVLYIPLLARTHILVFCSVCAYTHLHVYCLEDADC